MKMYKTDFDAIIIGGGPAGSMAGINLSRAGLKTAIIERKAFPRETLCGEFLSWEVMEILQKTDLFNKFLALKPNRISSLQFITEHNVFKSKLFFEGYSLQRSDFDDFLLNEAVNSGVILIQPAEVKEVSFNSNYFTVKVKSRGENINLTAAFVVGAYGKNNLLDKKLNRKYLLRRTGYSGIKFHIKRELLSDLDDTSIYIFSGKKIYCGINTVSRGEVTVCFLDKRGPGKVSPRDNFEKLVNGNKYLAAMFNNKAPDIKKLEIYGAGNIYFGQKELIKNGIIMIGDAAKIIAPLAGDGIAMALQSAKIASDIIIKGKKSKMNFSEIERLYKSNWKAKFRKRTAVARITQNIILQNNMLNRIPRPVIQTLMPSIISATRN